MELKQLEVFVSVVKNRSFSRAAEEIFLSQSTISSHVSALERELGVQLLERTTRHVLPTKTGEAFFACARNIMAMRDQAVEAVKSFGSLEAGEIRIIASSVPAQYLLPAAIAGFIKKYPQVVFHIDQADSGQVGEALCRGVYDFGVTGTKIGLDRYDAEPFYTDTLVMIVPGDMDAAKEYKSGELAGFLQDKRLVMREQGSGTRAELQRILSGLGIDPGQLRVSSWLGDTQSIINAVSQGLGISFVSRVAAQQFTRLGEIRTVEITGGDFDFSREMYLLSRKEMIFSPVQRLFAEHLKSFFQEGDNS